MLAGRPAGAGESRSGKSGNFTSFRSAAQNPSFTAAISGKAYIGNNASARFTIRITLSGLSLPAYIAGRQKPYRGQLVPKIQK
jgi:hypothetical protein